MNIRGLNTSPISPVEPKARVDGKTRMQSSTSDRDADGRRERSEGEPPKTLKQEEFDQALEVLRNMPGLKSNELILKVEMEGAQRITSIVDPAGVVIRRLTEAQLWAATRDKDRQTGKILDKAM